VRRIKKGKCTPFLGAGACVPALPLGSTVAKTWAEQYGYPLEDSWDLVRVAEYLAVKYDPMYPKEEFLEEFLTDVKPPDFCEPDEPHGMLADLPLPVYMTTNYDDFMVRALLDRQKTPHRELLPWNKYVREQDSVFGPDSVFEPTANEPVVFHLHGHNEVPESLVLAEGDYLDFLVNVSREQERIPARIQRAMASSSLLFIGYSLADWSFRVIFRGILQTTEASLRRISVTVQLPPGEAESLEQQKKQAYLDDYFQSKQMRVYWGTAREFAADLRANWERYANE
jgi:hypothetical protein